MPARMVRILTMPPSYADDPLWNVAMTYREVPEDSPLLAECSTCSAPRGVDCRTMMGESIPPHASRYATAPLVAPFETPVEAYATTPEAALGIECPVCASTPGERCRNTLTGVERFTVHGTRRDRTTRCAECGVLGHVMDNCPERPYCDNCNERGHEDIDCPVGDDDTYDEPEYDQADYCTCDNCIAASQYVPGVE